MKEIKALTEQAIELLKKLIATRSYSGEEDETAKLIFNALEEFGFEPQRKVNNVYAWAGKKNPDKPTLLINAHHDTVKSSSKWTKDPFTPALEDGKLIGLGSNDDGGSLVSLLAAFVHLSKKEQPYNLLYLASAEEETSGKNGIPAVLPELGKIDAGVVGEPTSLDMATTERGLIVLDCVAHGETGHAARAEGENAIYKAINDIEWFRNFQFKKVSEILGAINMTVTQIKAGSQHNVVPDECNFVVDVRPNELYSNEEVLETIRKNVECEVKPRSLNWKTSSISDDHAIVQKAKKLGIKTYGSQTMSDQVNMTFPTVKIGPGDTHRSHTIDEYIYLDEIRDGIKIYIELLDGLEL
ncbi:MAG: M20 family metallo-hydrolase [Balneolaceae bacterium]